MVSSTIYAHWTYIDPNSVAYVEGYGYKSLADAFAIGGNITLMHDVTVTSSLLMNNKTKFDYWNKTNQISKTQSLTF